MKPMIEAAMSWLLTCAQAAEGALGVAGGVEREPEVAELLAGEVPRPLGDDHPRAARAFWLAAMNALNPAR
jgi:hypothetical protein